MTRSPDFDHWKRAVYPRYWSRTSLKYGIDPYVTGLLKLVRSVKPADAFELAIGNGYPFAVELTQNGITVTGVDISELLIEECAALAPQARAFVGGYNDLAVLQRLGEQRFALVYCFRSTWHFPDIENAIDFMVRIARPGGLVMFDVMNSDSPWNLALLAKKRRQFPLTIAKNVIKAGLNVVRPGTYMLDRIFGVRDIMYSPATIDALLLARGLGFKRLTRADIEGAASMSADEAEQKVVYVVQCP